jgi:hypothetical protein
MIKRKIVFYIIYASMLSCYGFNGHIKYERSECEFNIDSVAYSLENINYQYDTLIKNTEILISKMIKMVDCADFTVKKGDSFSNLINDIFNAHSRDIKSEIVKYTQNSSFNVYDMYSDHFQKIKRNDTRKILGMLFDLNNRIEEKEYNLKGFSYENSKLLFTANWTQFSNDTIVRENAFKIYGELLSKKIVTARMLQYYAEYLFKKKKWDKLEEIFSTNRRYIVNNYDESGMCYFYDVLFDYVDKYKITYDKFVMDLIGCISDKKININEKAWNKSSHDRALEVFSKILFNKFGTNEKYIKDVRNYLQINKISTEEISSIMKSDKKYNDLYTNILK